MGLVPLDKLPEQLRPGQRQFVDSSGAGSVGEVKTFLAVDIMASTGTATPGTAVQVSSAQRARDLFGEGSPLAAECIAFLARNTLVQCWGLPLAQPSGGVAAVWELPITVGTAGAGTIARKLNGKLFQVGIAPGDAADTVCAKLVAAVNALQDLNVEASTAAGAGKVTLTAKVKGEYSRLVLSVPDGVKDAAGVTLGDLVNPTAGSGTVTPAGLRTALRANPRKWHYLASSINDSGNLSVWEEELELRYAPAQQADGRLFLPLSGIVGDEAQGGSMVEVAGRINSPHIVLLPHGQSEQEAAFWAGVWAANASAVLSQDPGANTLDVALPGLRAQEYNGTEREAMLRAGIASYTVTDSGAVQVERLVSSYNETTEGARDTGYLDVQIVETVSAIRTRINLEARKRFGQWKLAQVPGDYGPGARVMDAEKWRSFLLGLYSEVFIRDLVWAEDLDGYKKSIQVEVTSKTRLEYIHEPRIIGQFLEGAGVLAFR